MQSWRRQMLRARWRRGSVSIQRRNDSSVAASGRRAFGRRHQARAHLANDFFRQLGVVGETREIQLVLSRTSPPVLSRALWQVTQYLIHQRARLRGFFTGRRGHRLDGSGCLRGWFAAAQPGSLRAWTWPWAGSFVQQPPLPTARPRRLPSGFSSSSVPPRLNYAHGPIVSTGLSPESSIDSAKNRPIFARGARTTSLHAHELTLRASASVSGVYTSRPRSTLTRHHTLSVVEGPLPIHTVVV